MILLAALIQASSFSLTSPGPGAFDAAWDGKRILSARISGELAETRESVSARPLYLGYPHGPKDAQFVPSGRTCQTYTVSGQELSGTVFASGDSFVCSDNAAAPLGSTFGNPVVAGADCVYDRSGDWLLSFDGRDVRIVPRKGGFTVSAKGAFAVHFKPNYYRDHLGYFLWDRSKPLWKEPIAGWCSWMAHLQNVREEDVLAAAEFFAENLKEYGYDVIQIDDGFQRVMQFGQEKSGGEPFFRYWTEPNTKFPHGMGHLASQIKNLGLIPGVWIGYYLPLGLKHSEGYVKDPDGKPHKGPWVNYAVNGLDAAARNEAYIDTIREFKKQGWDYFKIDTLRHVLYDSYRTIPDYWQGRHESMEEAYRKILSETKKAAGKSYVMACWGTLPELAGLPDGARIGEDVGPDVESMRRAAKYIAQFHYLNNVVWRNDPDYMCFRVPVEEARTWATLTFMAGGHVMVSDPISTYDAPRLDALRRVGPPIFTRPATVVSHAPDPEFLTLHASKGAEQWVVAARFAWSDLVSRTLDEVLAPGKYLAFDFWNERFLGAVDGATFDALPKGHCQVISFRPLQDHPQVLGTNRHMSQGAYELENVRWDGKTLSGRYKLGAGQPWSLYVHVPAGWRVDSSTPAGHTEGEVLKLTFPQGSGTSDWKVAFSRQ